MRKAKVKDNTLTKDANSNKQNMIGDYVGHWSGYSVWFMFKGEKYYVETTDGVRGIDVHCTVRISETEISIED